MKIVKSSLRLTLYPVCSKTPLRPPIPLSKIANVLMSRFKNTSIKSDNSQKLTLLWKPTSNPPNQSSHKKPANMPTSKSRTSNSQPNKKSCKASTIAPLKISETQSITKDLLLRLMNRKKRPKAKSKKIRWRLIFRARWPNRRGELLSGKRLWRFKNCFRLLTTIGSWLTGQLCCGC